MLVYILQNSRFYTFRLPKSIVGNYVLHDYDCNGSKRNLVNIYAKDGKWILNSNDVVKINVNGSYVDSIVVEKYKFYMLNVAQTENIILYIAPGCDNTYFERMVLDNTSLLVGKDITCDIVYSYANLASKQLELNYTGGKWSFKNLNSSIPIYISGKRMDKCLLNNFDSIFVFGLKIVVCGNLLFINNPVNSIRLTSQRLLEPNLLLSVQDYSASRSFVDFYDSTEYFSKSPIFKKRFNTLKLVITGPEDKQKKNDSSLLMSIVPSALMSLTSLLSAYFSVKNYIAGSGTKETLVSTVVMCVVMLFVSLIWPFFERFAESIKMFIAEKVRVRTYKKYLKRKKETLEQAKTEQKMSLEFNNLSLMECQEIIKKKSSNLFSINFEQDSFLNVKLGTGRVPLDCEIDYIKPDFIKVKDKLLDDIDKLIDESKYIEDAPYSFSLKENVAFINNKGDFDKYLNALILQLVTFHDYSNLKLVVFTSENSSLNNIRNLNHCWDNEKNIRFFATNLQDAENLSSYLVRIFNSINLSDNENSVDSQPPFYLIICDDIDTYRNIKIIDKVLHHKERKNFSILMFSLKITDVPDGCSNFVEFNDKEATLFQSQMEENSIMKFKPEFINDNIDFNNCIRLISNIPIKINNDANGVLPDKLGFLEMFSVGNVNQLNSVSKWKSSQITNTLAAPIGVDANGNILSLDLHEKKHGPHGLIAGMTGSGKSEFIVTYILSLAVNYSPNEVQFVLIDYKGGGLAGAFENRKTGIKLPHLVGTITNLDKSSMNRTLVSIKSELQRRQRVFNEAKEMLNTGTIDIYKYQKLVREGSLKEYMSHLFIICDEFAELKAQQPDFMEELVSAARIGRSLGIHLILATQKPSGVVDDQIWSNSKFKVCCKVQTAEDSKEMIRRDDAAYIKESGRFYLQVGYDEIFVKGQSAYTGTQYIPSETVNISNNGKNSIEFLDNVGNIIKTIKKDNVIQERKKDLGEELGNVLKYLIDCSKEISFQNSQLWLDNVPTQLYIYDLFKKYPLSNSKFVINSLIGEYDDPQNQKQGPVFINMTNDGNLWVSGSYGSGKTTLLSTMIYSSIINHTTEELNIYIVDLLAESLKMFSKAPQVGDFVSSAEPDKLSKLFHFLTKEVVKRRKYFSNSSGTFASEAAKGKAPFPNILVFINGIDVLVEQFDEINNELFIPLLRDCNRVGIMFVITSSGSLSVTLENSFPQKIALKYLDVTEYTMIFNDTRGIIPGSNPGRGLVELDNVYEFQTAMIFDSVNFEYNLAYVIDQLIKCMKKAPTIPTMPRIVTFDNVKDDILSLDMVPIGIEMASNCVYSYDFSKFINMIVYSNIKMVVSFELALISVLKKLNNIKIIVLDAIGGMENIEEVQLYTSNFKKICIALNQNIIKKRSKDPSAEKIVFIISNYFKIESHLRKLREEDENVKTIDDLIMESRETENLKFILVNDNKLSSVDNREWSDYLDVGNGIVLGTELDQQTIIDTEDNYDSTKVNKDVAIVIKDYKKYFVKYIRNR